jgi:hypothetical protein
VATSTTTPRTAGLTWRNWTLWWAAYTTATFLVWTSTGAVMIAVTGGCASNLRESLAIYGTGTATAMAAHAAVNWYRRRP